MDFSPWSLLGSFVFSVIGFYLFRNGKKQHKHNQLIIGTLLMFYSYFTSTTFMTWFVGIILCASLYVFE